MVQRRSAGRQRGDVGSTVVVGALYHAVGLNAQQGAAYVFVMPVVGLGRLADRDGRADGK